MKMNTELTPHSEIGKIADEFKKRVTIEQYNVLMCRSFELKKTDKIKIKTRGQGCGWVEVDKKGEFIDLYYLDEHEIYEMNRGDNVVIKNKEQKDIYLYTGQTRENGWILNFGLEELRPEKLYGGYIKFLVNISHDHLMRF